jgi:hypothetical protein
MLVKLSVFHAPEKPQKYNLNGHKSKKKAFHNGHWQNNSIVFAFRIVHGCKFLILSPF